jgi:hypothetical protein
VKKNQMRLSPNEQSVLEFLKKPKTAIEVANHLSHKLPPYGILRLLQRLDLVDKISTHEKAKAIFVASGRPMLEHPYITYRPGRVVMGVRL